LNRAPHPNAAKVLHQTGSSPRTPKSSGARGGRDEQPAIGCRAGQPDVRGAARGETSTGGRRGETWPRSSRRRDIAKADHQVAGPRVATEARYQRDGPRARRRSPSCFGPGSGGWISVCRCRSGGARCSPCSAPAAAARRPRCGWSPAWSSPTRARSPCATASVVASAARRHFVAPNQRNLGMVFQSYAVWPQHDRVRERRIPARSCAAMKRAPGP